MNKIIVSIVFAVILVIIINKITNVIYHVEKPEKSAYQVATITADASKMNIETNSESGNIITLFASTSAADGAKVFKKCAACHSISQGGGNKIGPALWGVLGRQAGAVSDYKYSKAMAAYEKAWSFEEMNGFLIKPKDWIKGTKMSFAGLKNAKDRAAVILYMNKNTSSPLPLQ
jgi:cytochrome c